MEARASEAEDRMLHSSTKEEALENAILATEIYMKAIKLASSRPERERLKSRCAEVLAKAEDIKRVGVWRGRVEQTEQRRPNILLRAPISDRTISTHEEVIVLEGSRLHGLAFPPWTSEPADELFQNARIGENLYEDTSEYKFSKSQYSDFAGWRRPGEVIGKHRLPQCSYEVEAEPTMMAGSKVDLVQDVTADCSVVAGLCAAVARAGGDFEQLLYTVFYPYDKNKRIPLISESGKYIFRLNFNGGFRKVVIDDRLPDSVTARKLYVFDRQNPGLLWPALLEKAYLKVRGGYDFPGSNSGTDLWVLIGWIPEQILLQSNEISPQELWHRVFTSFGYGDVIITLGTGSLSQPEENDLGLIGEHDYAVLEMKEIDDRRTLLVKNPWCKGQSWRGSAADGKQGLHTDEADITGSRVSEISPNTFWIGFDEILQNFQSLYLNWNPGLFRYRQDHHFSWTIPSQAPPACLIDNPQYSIKSVQGGPVWVLLSRHFSTQEQIILNSSARSSGVASPLGFISLYVFDTDGKRVYLSDSALVRGPFVDSPQTLLRIDLPRMACYTFVATQQALPLPKYSFTMTAFSRTALVMSQASDAYSCHNSISAAWTSRTAGGNAGSASYASNPQFRLSLSAASALILYLETPQPELPIHVKLVWANGQRVTAVTTKDILCESGEYRRGCTVVEVSSIPAGIYTIICSTFSAGQTGKFTLRVDSTSPSDLSPIAAPTAGRLSRTLPALIFQAGVHRVLAPLSVSRLGHISIIARHVLSTVREVREGGGEVESGSGSGSGSAREISTSKPRLRPPLKILLEQGQGPHKIILAESYAGEFSDSPAGVRITDVDVGPTMTRMTTAGAGSRPGVGVGTGTLWLVLMRSGDRQAVDEVEVEVLSECVVEVGDWGYGNG